MRHKLKKMKKLRFLFTAVLSITLLVSCGKYKEYDNNEVVENSFTGAILPTSTGSDPAGDFTGNGDSGTYSFAWENTSNTASLNFDITSPTGSVQMILNDKKGNEVLNQTLTAGSGTDTFAGVSEEGKAGMWLVTIVLTNFDGDGSYSLNPGN
jgi:hypothetical protein